MKSLIDGITALGALAAEYESDEKRAEIESSLDSMNEFFEKINSQKATIEKEKADQGLNGDDEVVTLLFNALEGRIVTVMAELTEKISQRQENHSMESPSPSPDADGNGSQNDDY